MQVILDFYIKFMLVLGGRKLMNLFSIGYFVDQITRHFILTYDYSDAITALCVLMGYSGIDYIDYYVVEKLYGQSGKNNPYRYLN